MPRLPVIDLGSLSSQPVEVKGFVSMPGYCPVCGVNMFGKQVRTPLLGDPDPVCSDCQTPEETAALFDNPLPLDRLKEFTTEDYADWLDSSEDWSAYLVNFTAMEAMLHASKLAFRAERSYNIALLRSTEKSAEQRKAWAEQASSNEREEAEEARIVADAWKRQLDIRSRALQGLSDVEMQKALAG